MFVEYVCIHTACALGCTHNFARTLERVCDKVGHFHDFQRGFYRSDPMLHTSVSFRTIMPSARNITNASQSTHVALKLKFAFTWVFGMDYSDLSP